MENLTVVFSKLQSNFGVFVYVMIAFFSFMFLIYDDIFNVKLVLIYTLYYVVSVYTKIIHISGEIFNRFYRFLYWYYHETLLQVRTDVGVSI